MKYLFSFLFLLLIAGINSISGQSNFVPGMVITNRYDTLTGLIDSRGEIRNAKQCTFKQSEKSEEENYYPGDIFGYRYENGKFYVSREVPAADGTKKVFLELLVDGIADLYYYKDENEVHYYMEKPGEKLAELTNEVKTVVLNTGQEITRQSKRYLGALRVFLADCEEIQPEINKVEFNQKSLAGIAEEYHYYVCGPGEDCINYLKEIPKLKVGFQAYVSVMSSSYHYKNGGIYTEFDLNSGVYPTFGVAAKLTLPRVNDRLSLNVMLEGGKINYDGTYIEDTGITVVYNEMYKRSGFVSSLFQFNYRLSGNKISPFFELGSGAQFLINEKSGRSKEITVNDVTTSYEEYDDVHYAPVIMLFRGGTGLAYKINGHNYLFAGINYEFGLTSTRYIDVRGRIHQVKITPGFSVGISF